MGPGREQHQVEHQRRGETNRGTGSLSCSASDSGTIRRYRDFPALLGRRRAAVVLDAHAYGQVAVKLRSYIRAGVSVEDRQLGPLLSILMSPGPPPFGRRRCAQRWSKPIRDIPSLRAFHSPPARIMVFIRSGPVLSSCRNGKGWPRAPVQQRRWSTQGWSRVVRMIPILSAA